MASTGFTSLSDDIFHNILSRLRAPSFAYASCVSRYWNGVCRRILSRPKLRSALSLNPNALGALEEVFDKVLSEPIRPDFVIVNVTGAADLQETSKFIVERVGASVPTVITRSGGVIGREARNNKFREVKFGEFLDATSGSLHSAILLTVGYVPGLKVDVIPLLNSGQGPQLGITKQFVTDINNYVASVSNHKAPACIILYGDNDFDQVPVMEKLDCAMPTETIILGDQGCEILYRGCRDSRNASMALVFARDKNKPQGISEIQFHAALSSGVAAVGPKYRAASVSVSYSDGATYLTARRDGEREILNGERILDAVGDELEDRIVCPNLYIGVTKARYCSFGSEKAQLRTSLAFHEVIGGDVHHLCVNGFDIDAGDRFQFFHADPEVALASTSSVSSKLRSLKAQWNSSGCHMAFGGLVFACCRRGFLMFERSNVDSSPFLENFPEAPFSGVFCCGEIGRGFFGTEESRVEGSSARHCLHVYSTTYLVMSYSPAPLDG